LSNFVTQSMTIKTDNPTTNHPWLVTYSKPRQEKKLAERLANLGFEVYCPLVATMRQWSDRKKKVDVPLFPSYVFVKLNPERRQDIYWVPGFQGFVFWLGQPAVVRPVEIQAIEQFLGKVAHDSIEIKAFQPGQQVKITGGPLANLGGKVLHTKKNKVTLLIESLGTVIHAELATHLLSV
jgi:transcriptional antiterminator RfaH